MTSIFSQHQTDHRSASRKVAAVVKTGVAAIAIASASIGSAQAAGRSAQAEQQNTNDSGLDIRIAGSEPVSKRDPFGIEIRSDDHLNNPVLTARLVEGERSVVRGEAVEIAGYTNYAAFVVRSELRVFADGSPPDSEPLRIVAVDDANKAEFVADADLPGRLYFVWRVYDSEGRFDETAPQELTLVGERLAGDRPGSDVFALKDRDEARLRSIRLNKAVTVTVTGRANPETDEIRISGQLTPVDANGDFVWQQIFPRLSQNLTIQIERDGKTVLDSLRSISRPKDDWFVVGQGDVTLITSDGDGPAVEVSGDRLADGDYITSRAAYYLKGKFGDGWELTSSLDTGEVLLKDLFTNIDRKDPRQLLRRLDSSEFYPVYGDDSILIEDAPTQAGIYARLRHHDSSIVLGNFVANINQVELAQIDRGLFGGLISYKSQAITSFGERKLDLLAFASDPGTVPARDEFRGTGGSLYFLNRQDITIGSERLRIEVRDRETGLVLSSTELRPQEDYDIDYFQGRITLSRPLASTAADGAVVRQGSSAGNVPVLVARYEYSPDFGDLDGYTVAARGAGWIGDHVRLGVTSQKETTDTANQTLLAADMLLRYAAGTYIKAEVARTEGPGFGQSNSVDGGLNFINIASPAINGQSADAYRAEIAVNFAEITGKSGDRGKAGAYYEHFDAGFSSNAQLTFSDTERWGTHLDLPIGQSTRIKAEYDELSTAANGQTRSAVGEISQKFGGGVTANLGIRHDDKTPGQANNSFEDGSRTDAALQVNYKPVLANWSAHAFGQLTLENDAGRSDNNRAGVGVTAEVTERLSFTGEVSGGDGGLGADVQLNRRIGEGSEAYIGYSLLADRNDTGLERQNLFTRNSSGTLTVGARQRFSSSLSLYGENRISHGGNAPALVSSFGVNFDPTPQWSFSGSFENGRIDDVATGLFKRTAFTLGAGYSTDKLRIASNIEARFEDGNGRDQKVWLLRNSMNAKLTPDWHLLGRLNLAFADNDTANVRAAEFIDGIAGFAYRPVDNDRLNILGRVNYFRDLGPVGQITEGGQTNSPKQESTIISIDANYDLNKWITLGGKYGYRQGRVSLGRDSDTFVSSNTHLGILRADFHVVKNWDLLLEGRYLTNDTSGDDRVGALAAIYRHIGNNVKVGVGYSFTDFSDDLTDQSYTSKGLFLNLVGKF